MKYNHLPLIVECRRRTKVHGVERVPPQSGDTFWQLQLIDEPYSGNLNIILLF